jgi:hypothetical protein
MPRKIRDLRVESFQVFGEGGEVFGPLSLHKAEEFGDSVGVLR